MSRRRRPFGLHRCIEHGAARWTELLDPGGHAVPDPAAVRDVGAAQPHRITHTGLALHGLVRSGLSHRGHDGCTEQDNGKTKFHGSLFHWQVEVLARCRTSDRRLAAIAGGVFCRSLRRRQVQQRCNRGVEQLRPCGFGIDLGREPAEQHRKGRRLVECGVEQREEQRRMAAADDLPAMPASNSSRALVSRT